MFVSTCDFSLTMWLLEVWIYKPLHTPLLCGREAELKIGRFGGSEQPALCEALQNILSIGVLFAYHLDVSITKRNVEPADVFGSSEVTSCIQYFSKGSIALEVALKLCWLNYNTVKCILNM